MVPMQALSLEKDIYYDREHAEADTFLYDLQLYKRKRTAVANKTDAVCRHLAAILKQGDAPRKAITPIIGHFAATPVACSFKCPYHASVMKTLLSMSKIIVYNPFILFLL